MTEIVERIKKLLRLGAQGSGASEAEAESAMSMAAALMLKHGIEVQLDAEGDEASAVAGKRQGGYDEAWHHECAAACGFLYNCRPVIYRRSGSVSFVGRSEAVGACEETLVFLVGEVERLYKVHLPRGLTREDRAEFRRTFKYACARRLAARAWAIMETLKRDDLKAIAATGSTALVVVESIDRQLAEADALLAGVKKAVVRVRKVGNGTQVGRAAGDTVQLQKGLE